MKLYTREDILDKSGARPEELNELEDRKLLVPYRIGRFLGRVEEYFSEAQLDVLRRFIKTRRAAEANRA